MLPKSKGKRTAYEVFFGVILSLLERPIEILSRKMVIGASIMPKTGSRRLRKTSRKLHQAGILSSPFEPGVNLACHTVH